MIDLHTHILPHLDDGARDTATALEMLRLEKEQGVDSVLLTPHYYGKRHAPSRFLERRNAAFARLRERLDENGIKLRLGAEVHFTGVNLPEYDELCSLAIEGTKYILVEFPFTAKWSGSLMEKLAEFVAETEYIPIIAHAERYPEIRKDPALVARLIDMGCLIQINARAFTDKRDKGFAFALLKKDSVHCIGSDAHDLGERKPDLSSAKAAFEKAGFSEQWDRIQGVMQKVLEGERVLPKRVLPVKKIFGFYR